jgi:hypothetical protein
MGTVISTKVQPMALLTDDGETSSSRQLSISVSYGKSFRKLSRQALPSEAGSLKA